MTNERLVRNAALPARKHNSIRTTYREETIECVCGKVVDAMPDPYVPDRHQPLLAAWNKHIGKRTY